MGNFPHTVHQHLKTAKPVRQEIEPDLAVEPGVFRIPKKIFAVLHKILCAVRFNGVNR